MLCTVTTLIVGLPCLAQAQQNPTGTWRGLVLAPESRCHEYDPDSYRYPQTVEPRIIAELGGIWSPYTGQTFTTRRQTDIEHIVARSEAHDSGLCAATPATRLRFARDLLNLTLASPAVNRGQKSGHDAATWLPRLNQCWFADRVIRVRQKYELTIDRREADVLDRVLQRCESTALVRPTPGDATAASPRTDTTPSGPLQQYDDNRNGRITCAEARRHGIAPVPREHPAYPYMRDGDNDGVVCE